MIGAGVRLLARVLLGLAAVSLLTAVTLFVAAGYVLTWPLGRAGGGRRRAQLEATARVVMASAALAALLRAEPAPATVRPPEPPATP